ncbi:MAG: hypothetical protein V3R43_05000 [bacterium]
MHRHAAVLHRAVLHLGVLFWPVHHPGRFHFTMGLRLMLHVTGRHLRGMPFAVLHRPRRHRLVGHAFVLHRAVAGHPLVLLGTRSRWESPGQSRYRHRSDQHGEAVVGTRPVAHPAAGPPA